MKLSNPNLRARSRYPESSGAGLVDGMRDLIVNLAWLESVRSSPQHPDHAKYLDFIRRGTCFVPYRYEGVLAFAPSRLLGYKENNFERHAANESRHGSATNAAISGLLGHQPQQNQALEERYHAFCLALGLKPAPAGNFGHPRKYWDPLEWSLGETVQRALPSIQPFTVGELYSRPEIAKLAGVAEEQQRGDWNTGYARPGNDFFIFANVGGSGRTGHNYPNRWDGPTLVWSGKMKTARGQRQIEDLLGGDYPVHVFWRSSDRSRFTYAGLGAPIEIWGEKPVQVRWTFISTGSSTNRRPSQRWRRGPPPTSGSRTSERVDGATSVYLLAMEGPVEAAFPALEPGMLVIKVGLSNDVDRRIEDLSCGIPPGCALRWKLVAKRTLPSGDEAFELETLLLERLRVRRQWIGGEFAAIPEADLPVLARLE